MGKPSYKELEQKVKELQQIVNIKVFPSKLQFVTSDLFFFRMNHEWFFEFFDRGFSMLTGYSDRELKSRDFRWLDLVHETDKPGVVFELERAVSTDKSFLSIHRIINKGGHVRWVKLRGSVFCDDEGRVAFIQGVANDITREKLIEEALDSEVEIFAWVANNLEDGIYIVSDDHRIKFMNQALIDLVGDRVGELCYKALFGRESVCPWSVMHLIQQDSCGFQDYVLENLGRTFQVRSFPIKMRDGSIGKLGQLKDITRTTQLQNEVKEFTRREEAMAYAADVANVGTFIAQEHRGLEARFRHANDAFCRITGYDSHDLLEMSLSHILPSGYYQKVKDLLKDTEAPLNRTSSWEMNLKRKDGFSIVVLFTVSSLLYRGKPAITGFLQDITESRKVQETLWLSQRLASIGKLAAEVAHEINNPLTSILTFTKLASRIIDREVIEAERIQSLREYLGFMEGEANRCAGIARNLLDFSRQGEVETMDNDLREIIEKTLDILRHRAEMSNIRLETSYDPDIPKIPCDYKRLQQAFMNMFWNAIEAMPQGGDLRILVRYDQGNGRVETEVRDTGSGIPEENLSKIFEPFFTTKAESKGVGLGLSVSYGIIRQHGGNIEVRSRPGEGTSFTICLPVAGAESCGIS